MVGTEGGERSRKEAVGMVALHQALRNLCLSSDWTYSVFWTIRPRPRVRGGNGCKVGDDNGSLMLMWEDGFCKGRVGDCLEEDPIRKAFSKMSIQLYNYGEGLMGKVASDKCHKWVFKEPAESESNMSNYWQSSFDAIPTEWTDQFESGIQTIAVIQAGHGLLQLGSCKIIPEDLHFVLRMRHMFESLGYQSGFYLSQLFSSNRNSPLPASSSSSVPSPTRPPPALLNWAHQRQVPPPPMHFQSPAGHPSLGFLNLPPADTRVESPMGGHDNDINWPNGLSLFNALTGQPDAAAAAKLLFHQGEESEHPPLHHRGVDRSSGEDANANASEFLSLDSGHRGVMETFLD